MGRGNDADHNCYTAYVEAAVIGAFVETYPCDRPLRCSDTPWRRQRVACPLVDHNNGGEYFDVRTCISHDEGHEDDHIQGHFRLIIEGNLTPKKRGKG
jgi:hypothetical protein